MRDEFELVIRVRCEWETSRPGQEVYKAQYLARAWLLGEGPFSSDVPIDRLRALPADDQRTWFAAYLEAARICDQQRLVRLLGEL
ncbi:hypothetical protein ACIBF5_27225 [Micromonospora sp. NPDC050417]|uniref:hypothetical protein n=1 Tax=Micromonospora sp. NPDC050417 TaxID=3364280 RepID=UPI0037BC1D0E